nr:MAG TPA: hypothetical protein [Caudoviricetes sp.]
MVGGVEVGEKSMKLDFSLILIVQWGISDKV